jgi:NADH-quinone oxidoreductase subunit A
MLAEYTGAVIILLIATVLAAALLSIHLLLGPRRSFAEKNEPFECGERPIVSPHQRFSVKVYIVAMLFILFDVEAVFMYPWAVTLGELGWPSFVVMAVFGATLIVGLVYVWKKGAIDWSRE